MRVKNMNTYETVLPLPSRPPSHEFSTAQLRNTAAELLIFGSTVNGALSGPRMATLSGNRKFIDLFNAGDRDGVALQGAFQGDAHSCMIYDFCLIGDLVDCAVFTDQHRWRTTLDAFLRALGVALHFRLPRAHLVFDETLEFCGHSTCGKAQNQRSCGGQFPHECSFHCRLATQIIVPSFARG